MLLVPFYIIAAVSSFAVSGVLFRYREHDAAFSLSVVSFFVGVWVSILGGLALFGFSPDVWFRIPLAVTGFSNSVVIAGIFIFALQYTDNKRFVSNKLLAVLAIDPIGTVGFVLYDPWDIYVIDISSEPGLITSYDIVVGPLYVLNFIYALILFSVSVFLIVRFTMKSRYDLYQGQSIALMVGSIIMVLGAIPALLGIVKYDTTPFGMMIGVSLFAYAILKYRLGDIVPIGKQKVINSIRDGTIIVNSDNEIIDCNKSSKKLLGLTDSNTIGRSVDEVFQHHPVILKAFRDAQTDTPRVKDVDPITIGEDHVDISISEITDKNKTTGWIILLQDITDRKRKEERLEKQVEQLDQFTGIVSHDLRNPLSIAHGWTDQAKQTGDVENLDKVADALNRMDNMIDDVLELAQSGSTKIDLNTDQLSEIVDEATKNTETKHATITVQDNPRIKVDSGNVKRLFENLIRNSLEHGLTEERKQLIDKGSTDDLLELTIGIEDKSKNRCAIYFADDGIGIPEDKHSEIFQSGYTTNEDGTGFGLMIVKQITHAHGWDVTVTDSQSGGVKFIFSGVGIDSQE